MSLHVLYLMLAEDSAKALFVKIGVSTKIDQRVRGVQTSCPHPIQSVRHVMMQTGRIAYACEKEMHEALAAFRSAGEWFRIDSEEARAELNKALKATIPKYAGPIHRWTIMTPAQIRQIMALWAEENSLSRRSRRQARSRASFAWLLPKPARK